jgi:hypothetical protein
VVYTDYALIYQPYYILSTRRRRVEPTYFIRKNESIFLRPVVRSIVDEGFFRFSELG